MNPTPALRVAILCLAASVFAATASARVVGRVYRMQQATVKIEVTNGPILYIDPTDAALTTADADIIFLTHNHGDHQNIATLQRLRKPTTIFVSSPPGAGALIQNFSGAAIHAVIPGTRLTLGTIEVEMVPMYNIARNNHPRIMNFVGYVINVGGVRVYHAGDTERFPEMRTFTADVAMLPLGQTFTMVRVQDAVDAAIDIRARIAIPIHWGGPEGTLADATFFSEQLASRGLQTMVNTPTNGFALEVSESVVIADHPASTTIAPGTNATLRVQATGAGTLRYQWRRNGIAVAGGTTANLAITNASAASHAGDYDVIITDNNGPLRSSAARVAVDTPQPGRLVNLSVRATARGPSAPLIVGAVVGGGSRQLLIRGIGPALGTFGVTGTVADPRLDVYGAAGAVVASNNDWGAAGAAAGLRTTFTSVGAFDISDTASRDAALVTDFDGSRTVHVYGATEQPGIALVELYDTNTGGNGRLINLSARNFAGTGDNTLIAGFVISGNVPKRLLIRGVGPRLATAFGVSGALMDPKVELFLSEGGGTSLFASNDNWADAGVGPVRAAFTSAGAFDLPDAASRDAALVVTAPAGAFTAQVSGVGNTTGEALIEIYELPTLSPIP